MLLCILIGLQTGSCGALVGLGSGAVAGFIGSMMENRTDFCLAGQFPQTGCLL